MVDTSLSGALVAGELNAIIAVRGKPLMIVSDNRTELTSLEILHWAQDRRIEGALYRAGQAAAALLSREL